MMLSEHDTPLEVLEREQQHLHAHTVGGAFLIALGPFVAELMKVPRICERLAELREEGRSALLRETEEEEAMLGALRALRQKIPWDESIDADRGTSSLAERHSLAAFDEILAATQVFAEVPAAFGTGDESQTSKLLRILRVRIQQVAPAIQAIQVGDEASRERWSRLRTHARDLGVELDGLDERHQATTERAHLASVQSAGIALLQIDMVVRQLASGRLSDEVDREIVGSPELLRKSLHGRSLGAGESKFVEAADDRLRKRVNVVVAELRRRLAGSRSRDALIRHYAARCEWMASAEIEDFFARRRGDKRVEDRLVEHLASFLFDHGLPVLTRPIVARLEPDLFAANLPFEPALYVEAKQFSTQSGATAAIRDGARQIWNTAERIRKRFDLREAFLVIFRRGGPMLRFEGDVTRSGITLRPLQVDVAPSIVSGSRAQPVLVIRKAQLLAEERPKRPPAKRHRRKKP